MQKVKILATFHRFVAQPDIDGKPQREKRESYAKGTTVEASIEDAEDWIAKGLAEEA